MTHGRPVTIENIPFEINHERLLREMRVSKLKSLDELEEKPLAEAIRRAINRGYFLIRGRGMYMTLDISARPDGAITTPGSEDIFIGGDMQKLLADCPRATILAATIGGALEAEVARLDRAGEMTEAYLLEMVGGLMADYMADRVDERIEREITRAGFGRTMRFSPGYGDWPLDRQPLLHGLLGTERIGISLTDSHIMVPRKSVSAVIGWKRKV